MILWIFYSSIFLLGAAIVSFDGSDSNATDSVMANTFMMADATDSVEGSIFLKLFNIQFVGYLFILYHKQLIRN